jgi:hypothetical protein
MTIPYHPTLSVNGSMRCKARKPWCSSAAGLSADQVATQRRELNALAGRVGKWALLLKLVNGFLTGATFLNGAGFSGRGAADLR